MLGILKYFKLKIAARHIKEIAHLFKSAKDPIPILDTADFIYNILCTDCTATYIGTTKRPLKIRIYEHLKDVYNPPEKWTTLSKHAWKQDQKFNFNAVTITGGFDNYKKRMILEITHITSTSNSVNQRIDAENLLVFYLSLLSNQV